MTDRTYVVRLLGDNSDLNAKIAKGDKEAIKLREKIDKDRQKLNLMWSYGNQIVSMMLSQGAKLAKSQSLISAIQTAQFVQTTTMAEIGVIQLATRAAAAGALGMGLQAGFLWTLAAIMQSTIIASVTAEIQQRSITSRAENMRRQIESYRST